VVLFLLSWGFFLGGGACTRLGVYTVIISGLPYQNALFVFMNISVCGFIEHFTRAMWLGSCSLYLL